MMQGQPDDVSPFFSIIIPMYNREKEMARALQSCFSQRYQNFQIIVVDDGSSDSSCRVVEQFNDSRLKLLRHPTNKGLYPARATGVQAASGRWILFLDSDDELMPHALDLIERTIVNDDSSSERYGFAYRIDSGGISPDPMLLTRESFTYENYIRWLDRVVKSDFMHCVLHSTFETVPLTQGKSMYELLYHLRFTRTFRTKLSAEPVAIIHTDSENRSRNLSLIAKLRRQKQEVADGAESVEEIWLEHGEAIRTWAPMTYKRICKLRGMFQMLAGYRVSGARYMFDYLRLAPWSAEGWVILTAGLLGSRPLALVRALKRNP